SLIVCAMLCACIGKNIEVGPSSGATGSASTTTTGGTVMVPPRPTWLVADACAGAPSQPIVGIWKGYIESQQAPWDELLLDIRGVSASGPLCGTMTVGMGTPPAPPTDPNVGWPPGLKTSIAFAAPIMPGFAYDLIDGTLEDGRARFGLPQNQP